MSNTLIGPGYLLVPVKYLVSPEVISVRFFFAANV